MAQPPRRARPLFRAMKRCEDRAASSAAALAGRIGHHQRAWTAPARCARETAAALRLSASDHAGLRDWDYGRWSGRGIAEVAAEEPTLFEAWRIDADAAPPGGEALSALCSPRRCVAGRADGAWWPHSRRHSCFRDPGGSAACAWCAGIRVLAYRCRAACLRSPAQRRTPMAASLRRLTAQANAEAMRPKETLPKNFRFD